MINISDKVKEVIDVHTHMIETFLPDFLASYYIYGSVSLGAFNYNQSDIDFIAIYKRKAMETDIKILKKIHIGMHRKFRKTILDGMYMFMEDAESLKYNSEISCLRFNNGEFKGYQTFYRNSIDSFQLIKYAIKIKGKETAELDYTVDVDIMISKTLHNLNTYWLNWLNRPSIKSISLLFSPKCIEWGVLGVTRQYYTFREREIASKVMAGDYALQNLPEKWHKIISEAMRLRKDIRKSYYHSIFKRRNDALDYISFIIQESNRLFEKQYHVL